MPATVAQAPSASARAFAETAASFDVSAEPIVQHALRISGSAFRSLAAQQVNSRIIARLLMKEERRLWRAVLEQAYQDAEGIAIEEGIALSPIVCKRAQRYLRADSVQERADLSLVCDFADLPADRVYVWARRRYAVAA